MCPDRIRMFDRHPTKASPSRVPDSLQPQLQTALGPAYTIERELGGGGMSRVFVANEVRYDRRVVIKVLSPELAAGLNVERFEREISLAAGLQQANIVPVITSGEADGLPWYSMPFVDGESLRTRLDECHPEPFGFAQGKLREGSAPPGALPVAEAIKILSDLAHALAYAHDRGIVHRDIKPENILLSGGTAVVTDFGIAKALSASRRSAPGSTLTQAGTSLGTPAYMAPEQAAGDNVDSRTDLYAWGVIAYEVLAGAHPFASRTTAQQLIAAHIAEAPKPLRELAPHVPASLAALVMRCLAKDPRERPASAAELIGVLGAPSSAVPIAARASKRVAVVASLVALLLLAGGLYAWRSRQASPAADERLVAVLPFRVAGADPSLHYLREGMLDLLAAKLTGSTRIVDPRAMLAAWRDAGGNESADIAPAVANRLAVRLGAREVLLGEITGTGEHVALHASLVPTGGGNARDASVEGSRDSLLSLVDRLVVQVLALRAGRDTHALDGIAGTSLPAIRDYLEGRASLRRGSYEAAAEHFNAAVRADSNLAMAWVGLLDVAGWIGTDLDSPSRQIIRLRDRLPAATRAITDIRIGPQYPIELNVAERRKLAERAVQLAPDSPEAWAGLGEAYFHWAPIMGDTDAHARAIGAFERAVTLDSNYTEGFEHLGGLYVERGETASARRATEIRLDRDSTSKGALPRLYIADAVFGDSRRGAQWRAIVRAHPEWLWPVEGEAISLGLPLRVIDSVATADLPRALTESERRSRTGNLIFIAHLRGQPSRAARLRENRTNPMAAVGQARGSVLNAVFADGDSVQGAEGRRTLEGALATGSTTASPLDWFAAGLYDLAHGQRAGGRRAVTRLRAIPAALCDRRVPALCSDYALVLEAQLAAEEHRPDARARLVELDSMLREGPQRNGALLQAGNLVASRLWEQGGDLARALAAVRRRPFFYGPDPSLPVSLREEGRLAAATGDRAGALKAYRRYLLMRQDAEPSFRAHLDGIRREVGRLEKTDAR